MKHGASMLAAAGLALVAHAVAQEKSAAWPQWLGPNRDGTVHDPGAFAGRAEVHLHKAWSRPLETGQAGLAVADGRVFTVFREGGQDQAIALRADTGAPVWTAKLDPGVESPWLEGPPSTPAFQDGRVITLSSACRLRAHEGATGRALWEVDFKVRFGTAYPMGCATAPLVDGGRLYVQTGGREDHRLAAFDPATGQVSWSAKGTALATNSAPTVASLGGVRQIVINHTGADQRLGLSSFRLTDGAALWSTPLVAGFSFDTPVVLPGDRVALQTPNGTHVVQVTAKHGTWSAAPLWQGADLRGFFGPPVLHAGHLFSFSGDDLVCADAQTGKTVWKERTYPGSITVVDGHLLVLSASAGLLRVVEATPSGYREKARLQLFPPGAQAFSPPSYAGRRIFARSDAEVVAVDVLP